MTRWRTWLVLAAWAAVTSWGCSSCEDRPTDTPASTPVQEEPQEVAIDTGMLEGTSLIMPDRLLKLSGEVDFENRYLAAVMVTALSGGEGVMGCSGVAISRHVVLTSGHCVCARRPVASPQGEKQAIIDASACFETAKVTTTFYKPPVEVGLRSAGARRRFLHGRVKPHPALNIMLDEQGRVSSSHADLALIILDKPLDFPGMPLSDQEVQAGDSVIIVGSGYDEDVRAFGSERRACINKVTRLAMVEDERVLIQQPGGHRYRQDSGGPCLLQGRKEPELVGISSRWLGEGAAFMSLQGYRDWLREEIRRAETTRASPR